MAIRHLNQIELAARWNISHRTLERWRCRALIERSRCSMSAKRELRSRRPSRRTKPKGTMQAVLRLIV